MIKSNLSMGFFSAFVHVEICTRYTVHTCSIGIYNGKTGTHTIPTAKPNYAPMLCSHCISKQKERILDFAAQTCP